MNFLSFYSWRYAATLVYMLQSNEYRAAPYLNWYWHTNNFSRITYRGGLKQTKPARMLLLGLRLGITLQILLGLVLIYLGWQHDLTGGIYFGAALLVAYPVVWAHLVVLPLVLGRLFIIGPKHRRKIKMSKSQFGAFKGVKIAIAGSYGKTSMKELLLTVLSEGKKVAATPANKNVAISHAIFVNKLDGDEDILIIEYGEGKPGDVRRFSETTQPTHAVITGLAPAHLDMYKTLHKAGEDIFSVAKFVKPENVFVNGESSQAKPFIKKKFNVYDQEGVLGWKVSDIKVNIDGTHFTLTKKGEKLQLRSGLVGRHQVGPLALAAALAYELGLNKTQIKEGIAKTVSFEHRMQPYQLDGAWVIDDTYNGNIEGIRAGTQLLKDLKAERKIYVTPGLVDQGKETEQVHHEMGRLIASAQPDIVVLMRHSVTKFIQQGLEAGKFKGQLLIKDDPLDFYNNLQTFVAQGDLVVMQNDWPDNYS